MPALPSARVEPFEATLRSVEVGAPAPRHHARQSDDAAEDEHHLAEISSPTKKTSTPRAASAGSAVGWGTTSSSSWTVSRPPVIGVTSPARRRRHLASRRSAAVVVELPQRMAAGAPRGIVVKLCSGAGDGIDHSSVSARHGSAGASRPRRYDQATLTTVSSVPAANTSEPRLTIMFSVSQPRPLS